MPNAFVDTNISSLAIENNSLGVDQVTAILDGKRLMRCSLPTANSRKPPNPGLKLPATGKANKSLRHSPIHSARAETENGHSRPFPG